ncbi:DUF6452 family protein [Mangrovibacterium marinum]|uniref:Uncharacterized protein n=1 Tax=Mangrovibacterium marinum TaxID=1639118 RepID=A0A2T5C255_9BACT|nr:DUF6452 family protein [Mangrovibacterium marinum]PTN08772.1 hypothetical protein C8N47_107132 [Mangrovibacterium marinum]
MKQFFFSIILIVATVACKEVYDTPPESRVQLGLYYTNEDNSDTPLLTTYGLGQDSIWYDAENTDSFLLPLSDAGVSTFVVLIDSVADTLQIQYTPQVTYESMESGFYYTFWIQTVMSTANKIDKIFLTDTLVNENWHENIQLYLNDSTAFTVAD